MGTETSEVSIDFPFGTTFFLADRSSPKSQVFIFDIEVALFSLSSNTRSSLYCQLFALYLPCLHLSAVTTSSSPRKQNGRRKCRKRKTYPVIVKELTTVNSSQPASTSKSIPFADTKRPSNTPPAPSSVTTRSSSERFSCLLLDSRCM